MWKGHANTNSNIISHEAHKVVPGGLPWGLNNQAAALPLGIEYVFLQLCKFCVSLEWIVSQEEQELPTSTQGTQTKCLVELVRTSTITIATKLQFNISREPVHE